MKPSEMSTIKCEFLFYYGLFQHKPKSNVHQQLPLPRTDDGDVHQLIEVSGEIDCKADVQ